MGIGVVTNTYRFKNRPIQFGLHLTINDCTSVRLFAYMSEQEKNRQLKHNKELFKEEVGYDLFEILFIWQSKFYRNSKVSCKNCKESKKPKPEVLLQQALAFQNHFIFGPHVFPLQPQYVNLDRFLHDLLLEENPLGGAPGISWWELELPCSLTPGLISDQKNDISTPFFSPGLQAEIMSKNKQIFLFLSYLLIWN